MIFFIKVQNGKQYKAAYFFASIRPIIRVALAHLHGVQQKKKEKGMFELKVSIHAPALGATCPRFTKF